MPELKSMFPSKYLSFGDLEAGRMYEGTIKTVLLEQVNVRGQKGGRFDTQDAEPSWLLYFHEFNKPMQLRKTRAEKISVVLACSNTDHWVGRRLRFYRGVWTNGGKSGEGLMIDDRPMLQPAGPALGAASQLVITSDTRPIPQAAMSRFLGHLKEHGKSWEDFLRWAKASAPDALPLAWGVELDAVPAGVLPAMKAFLDSLAPAAAPPPAPSGDVIDVKTGEVMTSASTRQAPPEVINDADIPF